MEVRSTKPGGIWSSLIFLATYSSCVRGFTFLAVSDLGGDRRTTPLASTGPTDVPLVRPRDRASASSVTSSADFFLSCAPAALFPAELKLRESVSKSGRAPADSVDDPLACSNAFCSSCFSHFKRSPSRHSLDGSSHSCHMVSLNSHLSSVGQGMTREPSGMRPDGVSWYAQTQPSVSCLAVSMSSGRLKILPPRPYMPPMKHVR